MLEKISQACQYLLQNFPGAEPVREYLNSRVTPESQAKFQFGYYPKGEELSLLTDLVGEDLLKKHNLLYYKNIEDAQSPRTVPVSYFEHFSLVMPYRDAYGQVAGLVARTLYKEADQKKYGIPKYKNTKFEKAHHLFGLYENKREIIDRGFAFIVEGQFDVIKAMERGYKNIVGLGTSTMTPYQFSVISRYTNNLRLLLDNDEGGQKGRKSIVDHYGKLINIEHFYIPETYKDIDEYLTNCEDENPSFLTKG